MQLLNNQKCKLHFWVIYKLQKILILRKDKLPKMPVKIDCFTKLAKK